MEKHYKSSKYFNIPEKPRRRHGNNNNNNRATMWGGEHYDEEDDDALCSYCVYSFPFYCLFAARAMHPLSPYH